MTNVQNYCTAAEMAAKWQVSLRKVQWLCKQGKIAGVSKLGHSWLIPNCAQLPQQQNTLNEAAPLAPPPVSGPPLQPTFLENPLLSTARSSQRIPPLDGGFSTRYLVPGTAIQLINRRSDNNTQQLFIGWLRFSQGKVDESNRICKALLSSSSQEHIKLGAHFLLILGAIIHGNIKIWEEHLPLLKSQATQLLPTPNSELMKAFVKTTLFNNTDFPDWLTQGLTNSLSGHWFAIARYTFCKWLLMQTPSDKITATMELLLGESQRDNGLYYVINHHIFCAVSYHYNGQDHAAREHLREAYSLAKPDRIYASFACYARLLGHLIKDTLQPLDSQLCTDISESAQQFVENWHRLRVHCYGGIDTSQLSLREYEIAYLAKLGMTNAQIAQRLVISLTSVKSHLRNIFNKLDVTRRNQLRHYLH